MTTTTLPGGWHNESYTTENSYDIVSEEEIIEAERNMPE